jgi:hypothetical protein
MIKNPFNSNELARIEVLGLDPDTKEANLNQSNRIQ